MGHENTILSQFIAIGLLCYGLYVFINTFKTCKPIDLDNIELFKVHAVVEKQSTQQGVIKARKETKPEAEYSELQLECLETLKFLGYKNKSERKFILHSIFNEHSPSCVQEFLSLASKKNC